MLRRHRQIRMQIHELMDACLFAISFWLAYVLRSDREINRFFHMNPVGLEFDSLVWLYLILIPVAPLVLEAQGFYSRPMLCPRRATVWALFKGCLLTTIGLTLVLFFFRLQLARWGVIWFGAISFILFFV